MFVIIILLFRDSHYQSGSMVLCSFLILISLNLSWNLFIYRPTIRDDLLYDVWKGVFPKMEKFVYWTSYIFCFQAFRISFCQFANKPHFDASIKALDMTLIRLNRFSFLHILLVLFPTIAA